MAEGGLEALLERARRGEAAALGEVYDRYSPAIYRYLYRRTGDAQLAEDMTGGVFLRMLEAIDRDQAWRTSFTGWLYRIADNQLTDHRRAHTRHPEVDLPETLPGHGAGAVADQIERRFDAEAVREALDHLKPEYAEVLLLRFAEGLPHAEVAAQLGQTVVAVKVRQHRALKALRDHLEARLRADGP